MLVCFLWTPWAVFSTKQSQCANWQLCVMLVKQWPAVAPADMAWISGNRSDCHSWWTIGLQSSLEMHCITVFF